LEDLKSEFGEGIHKKNFHTGQLKRAPGIKRLTR